MFYLTWYNLTIGEFVCFNILAIVCVQKLLFFYNRIIARLQKNHCSVKIYVNKLCWPLFYARQNHTTGSHCKNRVNVLSAY